jgi:hypothetical protein
MVEHIFSADPDLPLNKKIQLILAFMRMNDPDIFEMNLTEVCRSIYSLGFDDGQSYVWKLRQMVPVDDPQNPDKKKWVAPGDPDYPNIGEYTTVVSSGHNKCDDWCVLYKNRDALICEQMNCTLSKEVASS